MDFDIVAYLMAGSRNAPIVILGVIALTFLAGQFGLKGKGQLGFALVLGLLAGGGLQIAEVGVPSNFNQWYFLTIYSVILAVCPSLLYDTGKDLMTKVISDVMSQVGVTFLEGRNE